MASEEIEKRLGAIEKLLYSIVEEKKEENRVIKEIIDMLIEERKWIKSFKGYNYFEKSNRIEQVNLIIEKLKTKGGLNSSQP